MPTYILGISAYYHDSAAAILCDGEIIAAAQEERFTRKKHDDEFPRNAVQYVLDEAGIGVEGLTAILFYDKPFIKFERLLETYHAFAPRGLVSFLSAMPVWIRDKLFLKRKLRNELKYFGKAKIPMLFPEHHFSHAASAFFPSPFEEAAILTIDGVGEWATCMIGLGSRNTISVLSELHFPHSIGLLYSAFTFYCGFRVNSGEYKLMGLAPYGIPDSPQVRFFIEKIRNELIDIRRDGSVLLNMIYFRYATGLRMTNDKKWASLFGIPPRAPESEISQDYMNLALAIQQITEEIIFKLAQTAKERTGSDYLVLAGGVALNSVANGKLLNSGLFKDIWIQPAAGDAGGALGAAYIGWHTWLGNKREFNPSSDSMKGCLLGPEFSDKEIRKVIRKYEAKTSRFDDFDELAARIAQELSEGKVVGWFQGRMEFGPRALGNRSILGDARNPEMQKRMNLKIKYREGFRPFAPSVLEEDIQHYFETDRPSPYMLMVVPVNENRRNPLPDNYYGLDLYDRLYFRRSDIPAITHIDFSARIQSVGREANPRYWTLINEFKRQTACGVIVNTSFNIRGEPIVCSPEDAYRCFLRTEMDILVLENHIFLKTDHKKNGSEKIREEEFRPD